MTSQNMIREAYVGEYASGKSENAINRSLSLVRQQRKVRLVDLDLVEPFYTLRPIQDALRNEGLDVIAWQAAENLGLGEAGMLLKWESVKSLEFQGDVILDVGYGSHGVNILKLIEGALEQKALSVYMIVNLMRPMTSSEELIIRYIKNFGRVDGLINNTHLGNETTVDLVQIGSQIVTRVAAKLGIPMIASSVAASLAAQIGPIDLMGNPVRPLQLWMGKALW
jgi:hypothetical protein